MKKEQYIKLWESQEDNHKVYQALWFDLLNASGWAGVLPNGNIVDRRYFPEATPVQENSLFGVNKPKEVEPDSWELYDRYDPELLEEGLGDKDYKYHKYIGEYIYRGDTWFLFVICNIHGSLKDGEVLHRSPANISRVIDQSKMIYELK